MQQDARTRLVRTSVAVIGAHADQPDHPAGSTRPAESRAPAGPRPIAGGA